MINFLLLMAVPMLISLVALLCFKGKVTIYEFLGQIAAVAVFVGICLGVSYFGRTIDREIWNGQVTSLQAEALQKLYADTMKGRYGADGSKALFQMIKEQNPNLDQSTFLKLQQQIESFRNTFSSNQTGLISKKQEYEKFLTATTGGRFYNNFGHYPHIDLSVYDIVTSQKMPSRTRRMNRSI